MGIYVGSPKYLNLPDKFINWIKTLYKNVETYVSNNRQHSTFFKPSRGVRQGCPLFPSLLILAIELLAIQLKTTTNITGKKSVGLPDIPIC